MFLEKKGQQGLIPTEPTNGPSDDLTDPALAECALINRAPRKLNKLISYLIYPSQRASYIYLYLYTEEKLISQLQWKLGAKGKIWYLIAQQKKKHALAHKVPAKVHTSESQLLTTIVTRQCPVLDD